MAHKMVTIPQLVMIAGTRAALGAGLGLLLADRLSDEQRRAVGWTLLSVGVLSTIPLAAEVMFRGESPGGDHPTTGAARPEQETEYVPQGASF